MKEGDNVDKIARENGVTWQEIKEANGLTSYEKEGKTYIDIRPGDTLIIPASSKGKVGDGGVSGGNKGSAPDNQENLGIKRTPINKDETVYTCIGDTCYNSKDQLPTKVVMRDGAEFTMVRGGEDEGIYTAHLENSKLTQDEVIKLLDNVNDAVSEPKVEDAINPRIKSQHEERIKDFQDALDRNQVRGEYSILLDNQNYIIHKHMGKAFIILGKEQFAKAFPDAYETLANWDDKIGEVVGATIEKADSKLELLIGESYKDAKVGIKKFLKSADEYTPELTQDVIKVVTLGVAAKAVGSAADKIWGGGKKVFGKVDVEVESGFKHFVEVDTALLKKEIKLPDDYNSPKLRSKFNRHKDDFGMESMNYNKQNAELFKQKIETHIKHEDTVAIAGTHRGTEKVIHYFNEKTEINVMKDLDGNFISGWKLDEDQITYIKKTGNVQ